MTDERKDLEIEYYLLKDRIGRLRLPTLYNLIVEFAKLIEAKKANRADKLYKALRKEYEGRTGKPPHIQLKDRTKPNHSFRSELFKTYHNQATHEWFESNREALESCDWIYGESYEDTIAKKSVSFAILDLPPKKRKAVLEFHALF